MKKRAITAATYNVIVQIGSIISSRRLSPPHRQVSAVSNSSSEIYRADDAPYYYRGNKVLISICVLSLITFVAQREYLRLLNRRKERQWNSMTAEEQAAYQTDQHAREQDGNKRLDFRFQY